MTELDEAIKRLRDDLAFTEHEDDIRTVLDALAAAQADSRTGQDMHQYWQARAERAEAESVRLRTLWEKTDADDLIARAEAAEAERDRAREARDGWMNRWSREQEQHAAAEAERNRLQAHIEDVEDFITAHYLDYNIGREVLARLSTPSKEEYQK
jgi:hypothetical protein